MLRKEYAAPCRRANWWIHRTESRPEENIIGETVEGEDEEGGRKMDESGDVNCLSLGFRGGVADVPGWSIRINGTLVAWDWTIVEGAGGRHLAIGCIRHQTRWIRHVEATVQRQFQRHRIGK